uniref:Uncharacterized protein n=1 Tax=Parascaris equorum TaxID=6256 RepID=A0A914RT82_PAREQ
MLKKQMTTMPSVVEFDPDDSLLNVVRTPGDAEIKHSNRHEFIPDLASPNESPPGRSRLSPTLFAVDSAERQELQFEPLERLFSERKQGLCEAQL